MKINKYMIAYFIYGLNALVDNGEKINKEDIYRIVESRKIISFLNETYGMKYWDFTGLLKYENDLVKKLLEYSNYLDEDSYRKLGLNENGYLVLSSTATRLMMNAND